MCAATVWPGTCGPKKEEELGGSTAHQHCSPPSPLAWMMKLNWKGSSTDLSAGHTAWAAATNLGESNSSAT